MKHEIKRLSLSDMDRAAVILRTTFDERFPWLSGRYTPQEDRWFLHNRVFAECEIWGAVDREIVGIIAFRQGWIDQFYILPDRQGQGAGSALLDIAKAAHSQLQLWTFQRNLAARRFYENRGFAAVEQTDGSGNEEREPDILYRWTRQQQA